VLRYGMAEGDGETLHTFPFTHTLGNTVLLRQSFKLH